MATKTSPSRRSSSRPSAKRSPGSGSSRKPARRKKPDTKTTKKPQRASTRQILSPHARDAVGIGLVVLAGLAVLSVWFDAAGPVGHGLNVALHAAFGVAAVAFPIIGLFWGVVLVRDLAPEARVRMFIGFAMLTLGVLGVISLSLGNPSPFAPVETTRAAAGLAHAAGIVGALAAYPLSKVVSPAGAFLIDLGLAVLGSLILTGTSFAEVGRKIAAFRDTLVVKEEPAEDPRANRKAAKEAKRSAREETGSAGQRAEPIESRHDTSSSEPAKPKEKRSTKILEAFGLIEEPVVVVPEAQPDPALAALAEPPASTEGDENVTGTKKAKARTVSTSQGPYQLPSLDLLRTAPASTNDGTDENRIVEALGHTLTTFGVDARVVDAHRGPTVTMYEVEVAAGTKVNKVLNLSSDIAYALATPDVRIIAPIPGRSAIGIEVPNSHRDFVMLGDILRSKAAKDARHPLSVALGKDIHGRAQMVNLSTMPHVLIAGATGAGKSSLVNCFITSILMRTTPDDVRLVLVDPKRVEMSHFAEVPHLLSPVIVHPKRAAEALQWIVREMEMRYEMLATVGVRDIDGYEEGLAAGTLRLPVGHEDEYEHLPYIVVVIDELADLMMVAPRDVEDAICRIAQMARAVGIHLVVATQRPSVDVVTGLIKANIPSRIALMTSSQADSRVVLDQNGAEKLVGHGDMLFAPANASKPSRLQGAWVTEAEVHGVADFIRGQRDVVYEQTVEGLGLPLTEAELTSGGGLGSGDSDEELLDQAAELVIRSQLGSTSMLQRKLKVGFARAGRLMDLLEEQAVVGPSQGSKAREVLITWDEWQERRSA
jgi:S-DNA-T family DNA segregation ATPase FtsK/SpoIIIE